MPDEPPQVPAHARVIVFDGLCTLCSRCVRFVIRRDAHALFRFAALQSAAGAALLRRHGLDPRDVRTFLLIKDGKGYQRSDAVLEIARELGAGWRLLRVLRVVPRAWRDALYDYIARRRYLWFGREQECLAPDERIRARFLE
jgi:predicted DCC family thiol-disulfide oxidoreductase YuxK